MILRPENDNNMRIKRITHWGLLLFALCIAVAMLCLSIVSTVSIDGIAYATEVTSDIDFETFTNKRNFVWNGREYSVSDFANATELLQGNFSYVDNFVPEEAMFVATTNGDHPIVEVVPKQLFNMLGDFLHIGKEYGFFIHTAIDDDIGGNLSTVIVFEINVDGLNLQKEGIFSVEVIPLFQRQYRYYTSTMNLYKFEGTFDPDYYLNAASLDVAYDCVVPHSKLDMTESGKYYMDFDFEVKEYYLKDISYVMNLLNEQEANQGYTDIYNAQDDNGAYFTYFDYEYEGISKDKELLSDEDKNEIAQSVVNIGLTTARTALSAVPSPVTKAILDISNIVIKIVRAYGSLDRISNRAVENENYFQSQDITVSNGKLTAKHFFASKSDQIEHYGDLAKTAALIVNSTSDGKTVLYGDGNYFKGYFKLSHSAPVGEQMWYTRLLRQIAMKVVTKNGDEVICSTSMHDYFLGAEKKKDIEVEEHGYAFLQKNGVARLRFCPEYTSDYEFCVVNTQETDIRVNGERISSDSNGSSAYSVRMIAGQTYDIDIYMHEEACILPYSIRPCTKTEKIRLKANEPYLLKVNKDTSAKFQELSFADDVLIIGVLKFLGQTFASVDEYLNFNQDIAVGVKTDAYDLYLLLNSKTEQEVSLQKNMPIMADINVVQQKFLYDNGGYRLYSFNCTKDNLQLLVNVQDQEGDYVADIYVAAYDSDGQKMQTIKYTAGMIAIQLLRGQNYIGVKSARNNKDVKIVFREEINQKEWQIAKKTSEPYSFEKITDPDKHYLSRPYASSESYILRFKIAEDTYVYDIENDCDTDGSWNLFDYGELKILHGNIGTNLVLRAVKDFDSVYKTKLKIKVRILLTDFVIDPTIDYVNAVKFNIRSQAGINKCVIEVAEKEVEISFDSGLTTTVDVLPLLVEMNAEGNVSISLKTIYYGDFPNAIDVGNDSTIQKGEREYSINVNCLYNRSVVTGKWIKTTTYYIANALQFYNALKVSFSCTFDNDINLQPYYKQWRPIGQFRGNLNGNDHTLKGLVMTDTQTLSYSNVGLIAVNLGIINNLTIETDIKLTFDLDLPWKNAGGIVGHNAKELDDEGDELRGTISGCRVIGNIAVSRAYSQAGGIVGFNEGNISMCYFGDVDASHYSKITGFGDVGGIAGKNMGDISLSVIEKAIVYHVVAVDSHSAGGIVGYCYGGNILFCGLTDSSVQNTGAKDHSISPKMGLMVGHLQNGTLRGGTIKNSGGSIGYLQADAQKYCFNGDKKFYGKLDNATIDGTTGLYGP